LCTYNGAEFMQAQLESIRTQTVLPDELVVGDDLSNDATVSIIENFVGSAPFSVRLKINENNLGSTKNFEQTISRCTGDIIFLSDQDDVWLRHKIEKIITEFEKNAAIGMVFSNAELVDEKLKSLGRKLWDFSFLPKYRRKIKNESFFELLLWQNIVTGATMAFRAKFRQSFAPIPTHIPNFIHDAWISLVIAAQAQIGFIDEPLIKYRQHPKQQLGIDRKYENRRMRYEDSIKSCREDLKRLDLMREVLNDYPQFQNAGTENYFDELINRYLDEKRELIEHFAVRMKMPKAKLKRISPILQEIQNGRYRHFSKGLASAAKDFLGNE
ncbi:MAG: glycosyltransferase family 2 protein, partial [Acidobacteria bacterium]|nr:glycosyltransferase family 2 protein [Acidobacteriota bacterium]